jgi:hypothetical protein
MGLYVANLTLRFVISLGSPSRFKPCLRYKKIKFQSSNCALIFWKFFRLSKLIPTNEYFTFYHFWKIFKNPLNILLDENEPFFWAFF